MRLQAKYTKMIPEAMNYFEDGPAMIESGYDGSTTHQGDGRGGHSTDTLNGLAKVLTALEGLFGSSMSKILYTSSIPRVRSFPPFSPPVRARPWVQIDQMRHVPALWMAQVLPSSAAGVAPLLRVTRTRVLHRARSGRPT